LRLLLVSHSIQEWTKYFSRYFKESGTETLVASFSPKNIEGIKTEFLAGPEYNALKDKHCYFTSVPKLRKIIKRFNPDVVMAVYLASNGLTAALSWKGPLLVCAVGSDVLERGYRKSFSISLRNLLIKFVSRKADLINSVSTEISDKLKKLGVPESKILEMPFGVDTKTFYPAENMPRACPRKFICTRAHKLVYDIPTVIEALSILKQKNVPFHCIFTSDGPELEKHKNMVKEKDLRDCVDFTGFLEHDVLPRALREADIYISASIGDGTSVSLLEAMATGLFPVVSNIRANAPWVEHGITGLLFETGNSEDLAQKLQQAVNDDKIQKNAGKKNRELIKQKCDIHTNMNVLAQKLQELANSAKDRYNQPRL